MMRLTSLVAAASALTLLLASTCQAAIDCPEMPDKVTQVNRDVRAEIAANVGSLGKVKAGELSIKTETTAKNLFEKYPNVDRLLVVQMMSATYCTMLRESKSFTDAERQLRWEQFQDKVFRFMSPAQPAGESKPASATSVLDARTLGLSQVLYGRDDTGRFASIVLNNIAKRKYIVKKVIYSRGRSSAMDQLNNICCPFCGGPAIYAIDDFDSISGPSPKTGSISFQDESGQRATYSGRVAFSHGCSYPTFAQLELPVAISVAQESTFEIKVYIRKRSEGADRKAIAQDDSVFKEKDILAPKDSICVYVYVDGASRLQHCQPEKSVNAESLFL